MQSFFIVYIHTHLTDSVDLKYIIAEQLIQVNPRRINLYQICSELISGNLECQNFPGQAPGPPDLSSTSYSSAIHAHAYSMCACV